VDKWAAVLLTVFAGSLVAMQAPINSMLGRSVGTFAAASLSFAIGLTVLVGITLVAGSGGFHNLGEAGDLKWYYLTGGVLGAIYVTSVLVSVRTLGAGGVTAATIAGQLTLAVIIDRLGWFGVDKHGFTVERVVGLALLAVGTFLVVRGK